MRKTIRIILALCLLLTLIFPVFAQNAADMIPAERNPNPGQRLLPRVIDDASVLTQEQILELNTLLDTLSEENGFDIAICAMNGLPEGYILRDFADDYFDYCGFGIGSDRSGCVLVVSVGEQRDWWISTRGKLYDKLSDEDIDTIFDGIQYSFGTSENYAAAFRAYAETTVSVMRQEMQEAKLVLGGVGLAVGVVVAFLIMGALKKQLKSVSMAAAANQYLQRDSLQITNSTDRYLYSHVTRTKRASSNSSGHTSSSGASHGGGGRSF